MSQNTNVTEYVTAGDDAQESALPWSYRQRPWLRYLIDVVSGAALGIVGTFAHRMGAAQNIPYGLVLALLLVALGAWSARSRDASLSCSCYCSCSRGDSSACRRDVWADANPRMTPAQTTDGR